MPNLHDLLAGELIIGDLRARDKEGVIREFAALLRTAGRIGDADELVRVVLDREALGSTGIGDGIAIPHAKSAALADVVVAFGRSGAGVDFHSLDGKPAHLFFLLVTPADKPGDHLKTLARISRIMKNPQLRRLLMDTAGPEEILRLILEEDGKYQPR